MFGNNRFLMPSHFVNVNELWVSNTIVRSGRGELKLKILSCLARSSGDG
jgi:hypothetical protein